MSRQKKQNWYVNPKKYHFIYKTTCQVNGKYYYGMHSTDSLDDGYIGSGTYLWHSIKKHGRENFVLEILEFCSDRETLKLREAELITEEMLSDPMCMNLTLGGEGSWEHLKLPHHAEKMKLVRAKNCSSISHEKRILGARKSGLMSKGQPFFKDSKFQSEMCERALSIKSRTKRLESFSKINHQTGEKNSQFAKRWMNKDGVTIRVQEVETYKLETDGWKRGKAKNCALLV